MSITLTQTFINGGTLKQLQMPKYFYNGFFGLRHFSPTDTIIFDDVYEDYRGLAKFVSPNVVATVNQTKTFDVKSWRPAYLKEKDELDASSEVLQTRVAGEAIGGTLSPQDRAMKIRAKQLLMHRIKMHNRFELMCFDALAAGRLVVGGDAQYPQATIDYYRDPSLTQTTAGTKKWSTATNNPLEILAELSDLVYEKSQEEVDTIIMGRKAWLNFYNYFTNKDRAHLFNKEIRGSDLTLNLLWVGEVRNVDMVGRFTTLNGTTIEVYLDNRTYLDATGVTKRYVAENEVIGIASSAFKGVIAFGAIKDADAGWQAMEMFHKEFRVQEPSRDYLLTQSAPLPIALNPNTTFRILDVNS